MSRPWFCHTPYTEHDFLARVLGRDLSGRAAQLKGYSLQTHGNYTYLLADPEASVEGRLIELRTGDEWLLDDEFGVPLGYYRKLEETVDCAGEQVLAMVLVGGPALAGLDLEPPTTPGNGQDKSGQT
jgi:hypothetical protein